MHGFELEALDGDIHIDYNKELSKIPDPRQPKKVKHKLTVVLLYGLLSFVLQMASRREANRKLSRPAFTPTLQALFPELESLPHADTLHRLLQEIEVQALEETPMELLRRWIRNKKFGSLGIVMGYPNILCCQCAKASCSSCVLEDPPHPA